MPTEKECSTRTLDGNLGGSASDDERQSGLDVLKCMAALFVVCIHFGTAPMNPVVRVAVPIFFVISGYYYPTLTARGRFWRHMGKLLAMTLCASSLYGVYTLIALTGEGTLGDWAAQTFTPGSLAWKVALNHDLFEPYSYHLWYFYAALYGLATLWLSDKLGFTKVLYALAPFLLLTLCWSYYAHLSVYFRNWLFFGLPCLLAGRWLGENRTRSLPFLADGKKTSLCALLAFALICLENLTIFLLYGEDGKRHEIYLFSLPLAMLLFLMALRHPRLGRGGILAHIGQRHSANIYIVHILIHYVIPPQVPLDSAWMEWVRPFALFALSLLASLAWERGRRLCHTFFTSRKAVGVMP